MAMELEKRSENAYAIGSFQAKTYFAELLRSVENGASVVITRNGHDVAVLEGRKNQTDDKALNALTRLKKLAAELSDVGKTTAVPVTIDDIISLRDEGRKY